VKKDRILSLLGRIVGFLASGALLCLGALFAALFLSFSSPNQRFYLTLLAVALALCLVFLFWSFFFFGKRERLRRALSLGATGLLSLTLVSFWVYQGVVKSVPTVNEQGVDLTLYEPFRENTLTPSLDEASTLTLEAPLPKLDGATALYPVYAAFVRATYPAGDYPAEKYGGVVTCTTTYGAYQSIIEGDRDIIFAAGPSDEQLAYAKERGVELVLTPIGREAFVFFVNAKNPVEGLHSEEIRRIYSGEITNWKEVGGRNEAIRPFQRPKNSGSQTTLERLMGDTPLMTPPSEDVIAGMGGIIQQAQSYRNYKNALGYSFRFFATEMVESEGIRLLAIDGVYPDEESIADGTYPFSSAFYAVTRKGHLSPGGQALLEWILSDQGQELVEKAGYVPIAS